MGLAALRFELVFCCDPTPRKHRNQFLLNSWWLKVAAKGGG